MICLDIIKEYPGVSLLKEIVIRRVCIDRGLDADSKYELSKQIKTDLVVADCLVAAVNSPDFKENDLSENLSRESMLKSAENIYKEHGDAKALNTQSTVTGRNVW